MVVVIQVMAQVMMVVLATSQKQMMILQTLIADRVAVLGVTTGHGSFDRFVVGLVVARFRVVLRQLVDNRWKDVIGVMRYDQSARVTAVRHQRMLRRVVVVIRSVIPVVVALLPHRIGR